jgi:hypothetical protein
MKIREKRTKNGENRTKKIKIYKSVKNEQKKVEKRTKKGSTKTKIINMI